VPRRGLLFLVLALTGGATGDASAMSSRHAKCAPMLSILSPVDGARVAAPFPVRYRVSCFRVGPSYGHLHAWGGRPGASFRSELRLLRQAGTTTFPDHPYATGYHKTLTFELARRDHTRVLDRSARVIVRNVLISGSK
jgi:hypothetical protein